MERQLNTDSIKKAMDSRGLSRAKIASSLEVSKTIVGNWLEGQKFPRPEKLLRLGLLLGLSFDQIVVDTTPSSVCNFRQKAKRSLTSEHEKKARNIGLLLNSLEKYLDDSDMLDPSPLREPSLQYTYIQKVSMKMRKKYGFKNEPKDIQRLIKALIDLNVILVPVFWGANDEREHDAHGLCIQTSAKRFWIFINLDASVLDFKFWLAHEFGHILSLNISGDREKEEFAEKFAQSFLFPIDMAERHYPTLSKISDPTRLTKKLVEISSPMIISPYTVYKSVNAYAEDRKLALLSPINRSYGIIASHVAAQARVYNILFKMHINESGAVTPESYTKIAKNIFKTPVFEALSQCITGDNKSPGFIQSILDCSPTDAMELYSHLVG